LSSARPFGQTRSSPRFRIVSGPPDVDTLLHENNAYRGANTSVDAHVARQGWRLQTRRKEVADSRTGRARRSPASERALCTRARQATQQRLSAGGGRGGAGRRGGPSRPWELERAPLDERLQPGAVQAHPVDLAKALVRDEDPFLARGSARSEDKAKGACPP